VDVEHFVERNMELRHQPHEALADYENTMKGSAKKAIANEQSRPGILVRRISRSDFCWKQRRFSIDACPMEGFNPVEFNRILGLEIIRQSLMCNRLS
jgi:hypothetical protein